jgi:hypothetical protein
MRVVKKEKPKQDVPEILKSNSNDSEDCFGKEWLHGCLECNMCMAQSVCMIVQTSKVFKQGETLKKTTWVDEIDFDAVPYEDILNLIKDPNNKFTVQDVRDVFEQTSKCLDKTTVNLKVNMWLTDNKIKIQNGYLSTI